MPVIVTVQAVKDFYFHDRNVRVGELVAMRALEAAALHRLGRVSLTRPAARAELQPRAPIQTAAAEAAPEPRRRYKRRDLQPEP